VQSERDPLTGLANRRHFREVLATRGVRPSAALLLVDVDHFKRINDEFGHPAGDAVLIEVARRLDSSVRAGDSSAAGVGGVPDLRAGPAGEALDALALRVLRALGDEAIALDNGRFLPVSASLGYAAFLAGAPGGAGLGARGQPGGHGALHRQVHGTRPCGGDPVGVGHRRAGTAVAGADFEAARLAGEVDLQVSLRRDY
jgi:diguanylate cyclase (GGDEF)-like protein